MTPYEIYNVIPSGVAECARCGCDVTDANIGALRQIGGLARNASVCLPFCQSCAEAIDEERAAFERPAATAITLHRRPLGTQGRRYPANGRALAEAPPPIDQAVTVAIGWPVAETVSAPKIIVQHEDDPAKLRFDVAAGRRIFVAHNAAADAGRLLDLAQALIDYGAVCIDFVVHPRRPDTGRERLRVWPEDRA